MLLGICGLALVICLSAYLLIYNILYLSVSGKIRYYGLLQSLGMTKKQLISFLVRQTLLPGLAGMCIGILSGVVLCMKFVPYILEVFGIAAENVEPHFHLAVLMISIAVTGASLFFGIKKPIQIAAKVTPVEAAKYRNCISNGKGYKKRKALFSGEWRLNS